MPVLWQAGLLFYLFSLCAGLEGECVLGLVGETVSLPCFHNGPKETYVNFSIEWRTESEMVLRSAWDENGHMKIWSTNSSKVSTDALRKGNFSLEVSLASPLESRVNYSLFIISERNHSAPLCTVCVKIAARFRTPLLQREEPVQGNKTIFQCHTSGGFPKPVVQWLIDGKDEPPEGSVTTQAVSLPESSLYNITSHLIINISQDASVSCIIDNQSMNETLMSTSHGVKGHIVENRASEAMWMFSTGLCVVVGVMVVTGVAYQIHMDKNKKKGYKSDTGYNQRRLKEQMPLTHSAIETIV